MNNITNKASKLVVASLIASQLTACGTLLYPERRSHGTGKIDVGVVALDALGLLLWFVPGVVAFGVDFYTGAIYLPSGRTAQLSESELKSMALPDGTLNEDALKSWLIDHELLDQASVKDKTFITQAYQTPESLKRALDLSSHQQMALLDH